MRVLKAKRPNPVLAITLAPLWSCLFTAFAQFEVVSLIRSMTIFPVLQEPKFLGLFFDTGHGLDSVDLSGVRGSRWSYIFGSAEKVTSWIDAYMAWLR